MTRALIAIGVFLVPLALARWYLAGLRYQQRWNAKEAELAAQCRWKELNEHFETALKSHRPMWRLVRWLNSPGWLEARYALSLAQQGRERDALAWAERGVRKSASGAPSQEKPFIVYADILRRLGRYEEARRAVISARAAYPLSDSPDLQEALIELYSGHPESAIDCANRVTDRPALDPARVIISTALTTLGRFQEAADVLVYEPARASEFFTQEGLELVTRDDVGKVLVAAMEQKHASVARPVPHLSIARICLEAQDATNMEMALDRAERELRTQPILEGVYYQLRAACFALKGDGAATEASLLRVRDITARVPYRSLLHEMHLMAGRAYLALARNEQALSELRTAAHSALHPIEKHLANYWFARSAQAAGQTEEASKLFEAAVADGFNTWDDRRSGAS